MRCCCYKVFKIADKSVCRDFCRTMEVQTFERSCVSRLKMSTPVKKRKILALVVASLNNGILHALAVVALLNDAYARLSSYSSGTAHRINRKTHVQDKCHYLVCIQNVYALKFFESRDTPICPPS